MVNPVEVKALSKYKIQVKYTDGIEGIIDLSDLKGKGIFKIWEKPGEFEKVHVDKQSGAIAWNEDIDICPHAIYLELKAKKENAPN